MRYNYTLTRMAKITTTTTTEKDNPKCGYRFGAPGTLIHC